MPANSLKSYSVGFLSVALLHLVCYVFFPVYFNTNDDVAMAFIANGYFTSAPSEHLIFINVILGFILKWLYESLPMLEWYSIFLVGIQFFSLVTLTLLLKKRVDLLAKVAFWLASAYFVVFLQFTHVAFLATLAGTLMLYTRSQQSAIHTYVIGVTYLLLGFLIRLDMVVITLFVAMPFLWKKEKNYLLAWGSFGLLAALAFTINNWVYNTPEWQNFQAYNKVRGALNDNPNMRYFKTHPEKIKELGLEPEEIELLNQGVPPKRLDTAQLEKIYEVVKYPSSPMDFLVNLFQNYNAILLVLAVALIGFYNRSQYNKIKWALGLFGFITLLICINHYPNDRIIFSILFAIFIMAHLSSRGYKLKPLRWASVLVVLHFAWNLGVFAFKNNTKFEFYPPTENHVVTLYSNYRTYFGRVKPFDMPSNQSNKILAGSWLVNSPIQIEQYRQLGISVEPHFSPLDHSEVRSQLLFIGDTTQACQAYLDKTVKPYLQKNKSQLQTIKQEGPFQYYKILSHDTIQ